jgi:hypothetical protein
MMTDDEILEVVAAHKEGKKIQVQSITDRNLWYDEPAPTWNFANHNYRVAPEPRKPREWWLIEPSIPKTYVYGPTNFVAFDSKQSCCDKEQIHVREVLE